MLKIFKQILEFAGTRKELLKKSLFFTFVGGIFAALQFVALYFVLMEVLKGNRSFMNVWPVIVVMAVSIAGRAVTGYISTMQQIETGYGMVSERRIHIGDRIRYIPMGYFDENSVGSLTALVTTTMGDIENIAPRVLLSVISGFLNTVVLFLMMFLLNWQIGLVVFCGALLYLVVTEIARKKAVEDSPKRQKAQDDLVGATLEYIQGMGVVKSFNLGKDSSQTVNKAIEDSCKYNLKLTNRTIPYQAIQQAITRLFSVIVAGMSVYYDHGMVYSVFEVNAVIIFKNSSSDTITPSSSIVSNTSSTLTMLSASLSSNTNSSVNHITLTHSTNVSLSIVPLSKS